jgi:hypothetical protein
MSPNTPSWVPKSTARRAHAGCVASLEQYSIRWQAGWPVVQSPRDTPLTSHPTSRPRGVRRRRRRSRHFYVTITRSCEYQCKKANVWPRYLESTSCQCWDPLITHSYKSDKCQVPVQWGLESPPAMPDTPQGTPVKCQEPGLWMCQKVYRYSRHCLTHHEETRQRMKASRDVLTSGWT